MVDDHYEEVEPVIRALTRLGIGSVYLSGRVEDNPPAPLHGIRLAIVDMDLNLGTGTSAEETAAGTLGFLQQILHGDANPLMVIVWTGSDETYEEFRQRFPQTFPQCAPGIVHRLDKSDFPEVTQDWADAAADAFKSAIEEQLAASRPLDLFWSWEEAVHGAASRTTSAIADIIDVGRGTGDKRLAWNAAASHVLAALARASTGQQGHTQEKLLDDLCSGLEPLLLDRLEHHRVPNAQLVEGSAKLIFDTAAEQRKAIKENADYRKEKSGVAAFIERLSGILWDAVDFIYSNGTPESDPGRKRKKIAALIAEPQKPKSLVFAAAQAARLNAMLHWSVLASGNPVRPGSIYLVGAKGDPVHDALTAMGFDETVLRKDIFASASKGGPLVLVEATPACDYAQGKWTMPRFVVGCFASEAHAGGLRAQADFLRSYGPLWLDCAGQQGGVVHLVLDSHFAVSFGMQEVKKWSPILMLRRRTLTDLQVWLSSQHMRQGLLNVT
ncbi:hypothetical protein [Sphingomonas sp. F9_3S_D5_B_2]